MGNFHPDAGEADHDSSSEQVNDSGAFLQGFEVIRQLRYERIKDIQRSYLLKLLKIFSNNINAGNK